MNASLALMMRLHALEDAAREALSRPIPLEHVSPRFPTVCATFITPDFGIQEPVWKNDQRDFYAVRLWHAVWGHSTSTLIRHRNPGIGYCQFPSGNLLSNQVVFDFTWNMLLKGSTPYGVNAGIERSGIGGMLSSRSLGNVERGRPLTFENPWKIPRGECLVFRVQPIQYQGIVATPMARYTVHFMLDGYWGAS